jgi:hypothetical protein
MWEVGDWLLAGEDVVFKHLKRSKVRELAAQITGYSRQTLTMAALVSRRIDVSLRIDGLSWWHHLAAARLDPTELCHWLTRAAEESWSVSTLRARLREEGLISTRSRPERGRQAVLQLVTLRRRDIPEDLRDQLREWWSNEMRDEL